MNAPSSFAVALSRYGSDLSQWPLHRRLWARITLAGSPEAARLLEQARHFDAALVEVLTPPAIGRALRTRLQAIPFQHPQPTTVTVGAPLQGTLVPMAGWWGGGLIAAGGLLALGFVVGFTDVLTLEAGVDWVSLAYGAL